MTLGGRGAAAAGHAMSGEPIGVLLVDDEQLVRAGLRAILESEPGLAVLGEAVDGAEVPGLVSRLRRTWC